MRVAPLVTSHVPGSGPYNALVYHLGEAAGPVEGARLTPFVGPTGQVCRRAYSDAGLMVTAYTSDHVRWNNVVPYNPGKLTDGYRKALVREHWHNIDVDLMRGDYKVIVACGGVALTRLTGLTNVKEEHGGVIVARELPRAVLVGGEPRDLGLGPLIERNPDLLILPCEHPAAVMQGEKCQGRMVQVRRVLARAAMYATGRLDARLLRGGNPRPRIVDPFTIEQLASVLRASPMIAVDTEFAKETGEPLRVQLCGSASPDDVFIWHPLEWKGATEVAAQFLARFDKLKFAHYTPADIGTFKRLGYDVSGGDGWPGWVCTLHVYAVLYPDAMLGLNHVTCDLRDHQRNWKERNTLDPVYMALDVWNALHVGVVELQEVIATGVMTPLVLDEVSVAVCEMDRLERGGLKVDAAKRTAMVDDYKTREVALTREVQLAMAATFARRGARVKRKSSEIEALLDEMAATRPVLLRCARKGHGDYDGVKRKAWSSAADCTCEQVYEQVGALVEREPLRPFSPTNDHDMRWLLYDKDGLGLPKQKDKDTGNLTVSADAIQKVTVKMIDEHAKGHVTSSYYRENTPAIVKFIRDCKTTKQLRKHRVTFLEVAVDSDGYAHPEYRAFGAGSGRPAGGPDEVLADDKDQRDSYNALNIPKELRAVYVPDRDDWVWVSADFSAGESWMTAWFASDDVLMGELKAHLEGRGPKVHALNAALIYGIDVADVKKVMVDFQGNKVPAYDNGKRISHLYAFGGTASVIANKLWIPSAKAHEAIARLDAKYPMQVRRRQLLSDAVFGTRSFVCARCGFSAVGGDANVCVSEGVNCPQCARESPPVACGLTWGGWASAPTHVHYTPFGRRRWYWGRRGEAGNALASQDPQSSLASVGYRTACRVNGYEMVGGVRRAWPTPGRAGVDYRLAHFNYDSFSIGCPRREWARYARWLCWTMEQPWAQLGGLRVPAEVSVGLNLAPYDEARNANGLYELPWHSDAAGSGSWAPLTATREMWEGVLL